MRMRSGSVPLVVAIVVVWSAVYLVSQVVTVPPLATGPTVLIGVTLTVIAVLGYPSVLRGPRTPRAPRLRRTPQGGVVRTAEPLRSGLTTTAAQKTVRLLKPILGADAVALTDTAQVLAYIGPATDAHGPGSPLRTAATRRALDTGQTIVATDPEQIDLGPGSPMRSGVIAPLRIGTQVVGTLKAFRREPEPPLPALVEALAGILSLQLELAEVDRERQLAAAAKLDALRAQINPHFLFNTLNTIASKSRTSPEEAQQLLVRLSDFFRYAIRQQGQFAEFGQEYFFVRTYLSLEQARYGDRLRVRYEIDPQVLGVQVPVLVIQPLVENAVKHGLAPKPGGGELTLRARVDPLGRATIIEVCDDGVGMAADVVAGLFDQSRGSTDTEGHLDSGHALRNISERLSQLYGERHSLEITSTEAKGTVVELRIPLQ